MGEHPEIKRSSIGEGTEPESDFFLLVSHTPDHFHWAVRQEYDLVLSGHTHGGQVRFPLIGPVFAPSLHGTRYTSGTFARGSTVLHVSRGVSGIHPLRWLCPTRNQSVNLESLGQENIRLTWAAFRNGRLAFAPFFRYLKTRAQIGK